MAQYPCIIFSVYVPMVFQHNLILGQSSGFICTENVYGTEILDRIKVFDNRLFLAHRYGSLSQAGGHDHGEHFRCQANCNRNAKQEGFQPVSFCYAINKKHQRDHDHHKTDQYPGNCINPFGKAGFYCLFSYCRSHCPKEGMVPYTDDNCRCAAGNNVAPHKGYIAVVCNGVLLRLYHFRCFLNRLTFAGKTCLTDK